MRKSISTVFVFVATVFILIITGSTIMMTVLQAQIANAEIDKSYIEGIGGGFKLDLGLSYPFSDLKHGIPPTSIIFYDSNHTEIYKTVFQTDEPITEVTNITLHFDFSENAIPDGTDFRICAKDSMMSVCDGDINEIGPRNQSLYVDMGEYVDD